MAREERLPNWLPICQIWFCFVVVLSRAQPVPIAGTKWSARTADTAFFATAEERLNVSRPSYFKTPPPAIDDGKYFHESRFEAHYDGRFAVRPIPPTERLEALRLLVQSYFTVLEDLELRSWIMHGSLLGWWWGGKIMPWDVDLDVQMTQQTLVDFATMHNHSIFTFDATLGDNDENSTSTVHEYLLDVNSHYLNGSFADSGNKIDARWIDTTTGLFVDITSLRYDHERAAKGEHGWLTAKDTHAYPISQIFPLRESTFEQATVRLPNAYQEILSKEYGPPSLTKSRHYGWIFNVTTEQWEREHYPLLRPVQPQRVPAYVKRPP